MLVSMFLLFSTTLSSYSITMSTDSQPQERVEVVPRKYLFAFVLVTLLFALWGFANDFTNPLVAAFKDIYLISNFQSSLVQLAFYGGYATMAIPAALLIRKYSYRVGIIIGLILFATGALLTIPASLTNFWVFLVAFYILTFGLAFLETTANPYILSLGPRETATQRLNLAQAFNPIGALSGIVVASHFILPSLQVDAFKAEEKTKHPEYATLSSSEVEAELSAAIADLSENSPDDFQAMKDHDLARIRLPYVALAGIVVTVLVLFLFSKIPDTGQAEGRLHATEVLRQLANFRYVGGVIAQTFYVGAQIMCWTFVVHYGQQVMGYTLADAQKKSIIATSIFLAFRIHLHLHPQVPQAGITARPLGVGSDCAHVGSHFVARHPGAIQFDWYLCLHVVDVSHDLRHCARWTYAGRRQVSLCWANHRHRGRRANASDAGENHRSWYSRDDPSRVLVDGVGSGLVRPATVVLRRDCILRLCNAQRFVSKFN